MLNPSEDVTVDWNKTTFYRTDDFEIDTGHTDDFAIVIGPTCIVGDHVVSAAENVITRYDWHGLAEPLTIPVPKRILKFAVDPEQDLLLTIHRYVLYPDLWPPLTVLIETRVAYTLDCSHGVTGRDTQRWLLSWPTALT